MRSTLLRLIRSIVDSADWSWACAAPARIAGAPAAPAANKRRDSIAASSSCLLLDMAKLASCKPGRKRGHGERENVRQQTPSRIPPRRYELRVVDAPGLSFRYRAQNLGGRARRARAQRQPHAAAAVRARRLHDRTLRP